MAFLNQAAFDDQRSYLQATGQDLDAKTAFTDASGNILFRAQTGGIISPERAVIEEGAILHRFADSWKDALGAMAGGWWIERHEFDRILRFAQINELTDPMAARILLGVPPEWGDMGIMVRVRVRRPILAWRRPCQYGHRPAPRRWSQGGDAPPERQCGTPDQAAFHPRNSGRTDHIQPVPFTVGNSRLMRDNSLAREAFQFEGEWRFSKAEAMRGWLYV